MKPGTPLLQSTRLLDQVRERVRYLHYSLKTEKAYLYWIRFFIRWSAAQGAGMRHPREMGVTEVEAFLSMLANVRKVSASTHNQALSALLFLYREVLVIDFPWLNNMGRPQQTKRIPSCERPVVQGTGLPGKEKENYVKRADLVVPLNEGPVRWRCGAWELEAPSYPIRPH